MGLPAPEKATKSSENKKSKKKNLELTHHFDDTHKTIQVD